MGAPVPAEVALPSPPLNPGRDRWSEPGVGTIVNLLDVGVPRTRPLVKLVEWADRHQLGVYLLALAGVAALGFAAPGTAPGLEHAIEPVLAALLFATFLQVPFTALTRAFRDARFLAVVLVANFVVAPLVVWALTPLVPAGQAVLLGVLLVLLTPCVDYVIVFVIVFSGLAGGASHRLLAAAPLLMLAQLLLPLYLLVLVGPEVAAVVDPGPFVRAFTVLIAVRCCSPWSPRSSRTATASGSSSPRS